MADVTHARAQGLDQGYSAHSMRATFTPSGDSHPNVTLQSDLVVGLNHPTGIAITPPGGGSGNIYAGLYSRLGEQRH